MNRLVDRALAAEFSWSAATTRSPLALWVSFVNLFQALHSAAEESLISGRIRVAAASIPRTSEASTMLLACSKIRPEPRSAIDYLVGRALFFAPTQ